jgi:hypothetical protein
MRTALVVVAAVGLGMAGAPSVQGEQPLKVRVSPTLVLAPGAVSVHASVNTDPDNRLLEVVAESADYYRSSRIQLDGEAAPRMSVFEFRGLPSGDYQITAVLTGSAGPRAIVQANARVAPVGGR